MTVRRINPNHQMSKVMDDYCPKLLALVMMKLGISEIEITNQDMLDSIGPDRVEKVVACIGKQESIVIKLMTLKEAERAAKQEGGLPH